jgi:hypothetical protein
VNVACIWPGDKPFSRRAASAAAFAAGTAWIRPRNRRVLARRQCFSAQQTDLSCRFRRGGFMEVECGLAALLSGYGRDKPES